MSTNSLWRWEQDGAGGEHGTATYFPGMAHEVTVTMQTFADAHALQNSIAAAIKDARWFARTGLLMEIGKIQP